jgi:hypothetical protein
MCTCIYVCMHDVCMHEGMHVCICVGSGFRVMSLGPHTCPPIALRERTLPRLSVQFFSLEVSSFPVVCEMARKSAKPQQQPQQPMESHFGAMPPLGSFGGMGMPMMGMGGMMPGMPMGSMGPYPGMTMPSGTQRHCIFPSTYSLCSVGPSPTRPSISVPTVWRMRVTNCVCVCVCVCVCLCACVRACMCVWV